MNKTTILAIILLSMFVFHNANAQYTAKAKTGAYAELVNPTIVAKGPTFTSNYMINVPGTFIFFKKTYGLDNKTTPQGMNIFPTPAFLMMETPGQSTVAEVTVFGNCGVAGIDATSSISYQVTGDTKTGTIKFQWKNIGLKSSGDPSDFINCQLWLNRADNSFTFIMGPHQITGNSAFGSHGGTCIGIDQYDGGFNSILASAYVGGDPTAPTLTTGARDFTKEPPVLSSVPAAGTMYVFSQVGSASAIATSSIQAKPSVTISPNPATNFSMIQYTVFEKSDVNILISDISGRIVKTIANETKTPGDYEAIVETCNLNPGIYFCTVNAGGVSSTEKIIIVK